jgi:hypothetical protein
MNPTNQPIAYGTRVHVTLPDCEFRGNFRGYVFGDPSAACEAFVATTEVRRPGMWGGQWHRMPSNGGAAGKFWNVRPLTEAEAAAEAAEAARVQSYVD